MGFTITIPKGIIQTNGCFFITGGSIGSKDYYAQIAVFPTFVNWASVYINGIEIQDVAITFCYR